MKKVIVFDMAFNTGIIARGETDCKLVDKHCIRVNGELYNAACIIEDTTEAECALELVVKANQAAQNACTYASMLGARLLGKFKAF